MNADARMMSPAAPPLTTLEQHHVRAAVRGVNAIERALVARGVVRRRTTVAAMKQLAWRDAEKLRGSLAFGWNDVSVAWEGVEKIIHNMNDARRNTLMGWQGGILELRRMLSQSVALESYLRDHPDAAAAPVTRPIFVTGLPRTGTTLLHRLISSDPANRAPLFWELYNPVPRKGETSPDARIAYAKNFLRLQQFSLPALKVAHALDAFEPEECLFLLMHHMTWAARLDLPDYMAWLKTDDRRLEYTRYRRFLQVMQHAAHPEQREQTWVLKAPVHLDALDALLHAFPDALVVVTHRNPTSVFPSWASLMSIPARVVIAGLDLHQFGHLWVDVWEQAMLSAEQVRAQHPDRFIDVRYDCLMTDPLTEVERVYMAAKRPLTDAAQRAMNDWLGRPEHAKTNAHRYSLAQFGIDEAALNARFRWYTDRYDIPL